MADPTVAVAANLSLAQGVYGPWGVGTALYYWLASLATGGFAAAFVATGFGRGGGRVVRQAFLWAPIVALVSLVAEAFELGNLAAAYRVLSNLSSPIAIDALSALVFLAAAAGFAYLSREGETGTSVARALSGWVAFLAAVAWLVGRALMVSTVTRPFWVVLGMPTTLLLSAVVVGAGALVFLQARALVTGREPQGVLRLTALNAMMTGGAVLLLVSLVMGLLAAFRGDETTVRSALALVRGWPFWTGLVAGLVVPVVAYGVSYGSEEKASQRRHVIWMWASLVTVLGMLALLGALLGSGLRVPLPGEFL